MRDPHNAPAAEPQLDPERRRGARVKLEDQFRKALTEIERHEQLADASEHPDEISVALAAALQVAEGHYRYCLAALKFDRSDWARWRCARALIEFNRLSEKLG